MAQTAAASAPVVSLDDVLVETAISPREMRVIEAIRKLPVGEIRVIMRGGQPRVVQSTLSEDLDAS